MYSEHSGHTLLTQDILLNLLQQSDTLTPTQVAMRRSQGTGGATGSKMLLEDVFKITAVAGCHNGDVGTYVSTRR